jgi:hypothetical protein
MKRAAWTAAGLGIVLGGVSAARAEITAFKASLEAEVERITNGLPAETHRDAFVVPDDVNVLPAEARAELVWMGTAMPAPEGQSRATAGFSDPLLSVNNVPEELRLEAVSYSSDPNTSFNSAAAIVETRSIVINADETDAAPGQNVTFNSQVFFRGTVCVWSQTPTDDLTDLSALVTMRVIQRTGGGSDITVLEAAMIVAGGPGGSITVDSNGLIVPESLLIEDASDEEPAVGRAWVVVAPNLLLPYAYNVVIGEAFELELQVEVDVKGLTDARGAAVVLGGPFMEFGPVVDTVAGSSLGTSLQDTANATSESLTPDSFLPSLLALFPNCAAMGVETFGLTFIAGVLCVATRRRRL